MKSSEKKLRWGAPWSHRTHRDGRYGLRVGDQETARVVAVHSASGAIVGAGCLVDEQVVLTCRHVVEAARGKGNRDLEVILTLVGVEGRPTVRAELVGFAGDGPQNDLALLLITYGPPLDVARVEFASPLRHGGKAYSVLGFPGGDPQGRNATGYLHSTDAIGLVQMDRGGALSVLGGFSGAPVWSSDLNAFVGLVVTELANADVSWCIPSRLVCQFYEDLSVRFRIPPSDRPVIGDYYHDDPNVELFGTVSNNGRRKLTATACLRHQRDTEHPYLVTATYEVIKDTEPDRGRYVTFITHPSFRTDKEDAYELFAPLKDCKAEVQFPVSAAFTIAAIGDAGDTALTFNLNMIEEKPTTFR